MMKKYELSFHEALDVILEGGAVKGDNFAKSIYMKLDNYGRMILVNVDDFSNTIEFVSLTSLSQQKFRSLTVMTVKELEA